jgi:hypothetical protein
MFEYKCW